MNILAIIGARSGSKGVPNKNIRDLAGKPLMAWIIKVAKNSKYINRIIVSTDSEDYANIARKYGAEVPYIRPKELSDDMSTDIEYIKYTIDNLKKDEQYIPDIVLRLVPTAPLQISEDLDLCIEELLKDKEAHSSLVVAEAFQHPAKALKLVDDGMGGKYLTSYSSVGELGIKVLPRQQYKKAYFRANVIASRIDTIYNLNSLTGEKIRYHIIPQERAIDIDSETDFLVAEKIINNFK